MSVSVDVARAGGQEPGRQAQGPRREACLLWVGYLAGSLADRHLPSVPSCLQTQVSSQVHG